MHVRMPRLVESHVGSAREGCGAQHHHPAPRDAASPASPRYPTRTWDGGGHAKPQPTRCPAVTTLLVSRHVLHLADDQLGELLHTAVCPAARRRPSTIGLPLEGIAQGFILAVLQHRDPPGQGGTPVRRRRRRSRIQNHKERGRAAALTQRTPARPPPGSDTSCCLQGWGEGGEGEGGHSGVPKTAGRGCFKIK